MLRAKLIQYTSVVDVMMVLMVNCQNIISMQR